MASPSAALDAAVFYSTSLAAASARISVEVTSVVDAKEAGAPAYKGAAIPVDAGSVKGVASYV